MIESGGVWKDRHCDILFVRVLSTREFHIEYAYCGSDLECS